MQLNGPVTTARTFNFSQSPSLAVINLQANNLTFTAGGTTGPGLLDIGGTGAFQLGGTSTLAHTGGTVISGATLAVINTGTALGDIDINSGAFDISAAANAQTIGNLFGTGGQLTLGSQTLTLVPSMDSTFAGTISGMAPSRLIMNAPFKLTLTGNSPMMAGTVEIAKGTVAVQNCIIPATFQVDTNGTLKGNGTVGDINNSGIVAPGLSIGTLHAGNYTEMGTLQIEVNDLGQSSSVALTGNLTISPGTTLTLLPDPGVYTNPVTYTVATFPTGTVTGTYSTVKANLFNRFTAQAVYNANNVQVIFVTNSFNTIVSSSAVASCIETISKGRGTDGTRIVNILEALSNDIPLLTKSLQQLEPTQFGALALAQDNNDILIRSALTQRFQQRCKKESYVMVDEEGMEIAPAPETPVRKGSIWFEPLGKYADQDHLQENIGYRQMTGGALAGGDYQIDDNFHCGAALGYTFTDLHWKESAGKANINNYYFALYGTWFNERAFLDITGIAGDNNYQAERKIKFPGVERIAQNTHGGYQLGGSLGTGLFFTPGRFQVTPFARADFVFVHQNSFKEHGARSLDLKIEETNSRYVRSDAGIKIAYCRNYESVSFAPYIKASWIYEKQLDSAQITSSFIGTSCNFSVHGMHPTRSLIAPSIGLTVLACRDTFSFELHDDAEIGNHYWENRAYINFSYRF